MKYSRIFENPLSIFFHLVYNFGRVFDDFSTAIACAKREDPICLGKSIGDVTYVLFFINWNINYQITSALYPSGLHQRWNSNPKIKTTTTRLVLYWQGQLQSTWSATSHSLYLPPAPVPLRSVCLINIYFNLHKYQLWHLTFIRCGWSIYNWSF